METCECRWIGQCVLSNRVESYDPGDTKKQNIASNLKINSRCWFVSIWTYHMHREDNDSLLIQFDNKLRVDLELVYASAQKGWQDVTDRTHLMQFCVSVTLANSG